jgi:hypothetical protein
VNAGSQKEVDALIDRLTKRVGEIINRQLADGIPDGDLGP